MSRGGNPELGQELGSLALVCEFIRSDGVRMGFTSHDRTIWIDGLAYRCEPGIAVSAIVSSLDGREDGLTLRGAFSSGMIRQDDVAMGRWSEAIVNVGLCDWNRPLDGVKWLSAGAVAQIRYGSEFDGEYLIALRWRELDRWRDGPPRLSPLCRARVGDARCGLSMESRRSTVLANLAGGERVIVPHMPGEPEIYAGGRMRIIDGALAGVERIIEAVDQDGLWLCEPVFPAASGVRIRLEQGCDRRFSTCRDRFGNAAAFDGEPFLPGRDALIRYGAP